MSERATRPLRQKVMLPLLAIGILSAIAIGVLAYMGIEAQLMRQLRYRAVQLIDTISVASESLDETKELQHVVLAVSVSPDTSLIIAVDANQRIIAASSSNLIDRQANRDPSMHNALDLGRVISGRERFVSHLDGANFDFVAPIAINGTLLGTDREQRGAVLVRMDVRAIRRDLIRDALSRSPRACSPSSYCCLWPPGASCDITCCARWIASLPQSRSAASGDQRALQRVAPDDELGDLAYTLDEAFARIDAHGQQLTGPATRPKPPIAPRANSSRR